MACHQSLLSLSFCKVDRNILMMTTVLYLCILVMVPALCVKDIRAKQRMVKETSEKWQHIETYHWYEYGDEQQQQQQQQKQQQQQSEQQQQSDQQQNEQEQQLTRQKRAVDKMLCKQPTNLKEMFQEVNSKLNFMDFLGRTWDGHAISILRGEHARRVPNSRHHHRCPASLNHHDSRAPLVDRQLCPHYDEVLELPSGYFPPVLRKAVCKCRYCIENDAYRCIPVRTSVWVLKPAGCFLGMQRYVEEKHHIATGCACAV